MHPFTSACLIPSFLPSCAPSAGPAARSRRRPAPCGAAAAAHGESPPRPGVAAPARGPARRRPPARLPTPGRERWRRAGGAGRRRCPVRTWVRPPRSAAASFPTAAARKVSPRPRGPKLRRGGRGPGGPGWAAGRRVRTCCGAAAGYGTLPRRHRAPSAASGAGAEGRCG